MRTAGCSPASYNTSRRARHGMAILAAAGQPARRGCVKTTGTGESAGGRYGEAARSCQKPPYGSFAAVGACSRVGRESLTSCTTYQHALHTSSATSTTSS